MAEVLFHLRSVTVHGRGRPRLDVELAIGPGVTAILGESGAGKTTLLDLLVGYTLPTRGSVEFHGNDNGVVGRFWSPADGGLWPHLDVRGHLAAVVPAVAPAAAPEGTAGPIEHWLQLFDLTDCAGARPGQLSLGQQSRLGVARALASGSPVLVLDEPLAHVDMGRLGRFWGAAIAHVRSSGTALVFATHDPGLVLSHADSVICLDSGRVVFHGSPDDLYLRPKSAELARFLGVGNWIDDAEKSRWLQGEAPSCVRPEHLSIEARDDSSLVVVESVQRGPFAETRVRHEPTGEERPFHHVRAGRDLTPGLRVVLRACLLILLLVASACEGGDSDLGMKAVSHRHLEPLGARLPAPRGLSTLPDGGLIVLDNAGRVLVYRPDGRLERQWMMPAYDVGRPEGVCLLRDGRIAVADTHYSRVVFFDGNGGLLATIGSRGTGPGEFLYPIKVIQDPAGNLYVAEYGSNDRVQKFTEKGKWVRTFGSFGDGPRQFQRPSGLVWQEGKVYVADAVNHRIQVFTEDGDFVTTLGADGSLGLQMPYDLCAGPSGDLYTCEYGGGRVTRFTTTGRVVGRFGKIGRGSGQMTTPWGITVAKSGTVLVADTGNRRIVEWRN